MHYFSKNYDCLKDLRNFFLDLNIHRLALHVRNKQGSTESPKSPIASVAALYPHPNICPAVNTFVVRLFGLSLCVGHGFDDMARLSAGHLWMFFQEI